MSELRYKWNYRDSSIDVHNEDGQYTTCYEDDEIADEMNDYRKALDGKIDLERKLAEANGKNTWIKKQQESWNSTTKETIEDLERKLEEARERLTIAINCMPQLAKINYEQDCK